MSVEQRVAYDIGGRYIVGKAKGISEGYYLFTDACLIRATELPQGKSLEEGLKEVYLNAKREDKRVATDLVMSPSPRRFNVDVK